MYQVEDEGEGLMKYQYSHNDGKVYQSTKGQFKSIYIHSRSKGEGQGPSRHNWMFLEGLHGDLSAFLR